MKDQETMQKFIELRSQGWTYARLMAELNLSKPTLINWSRKFQFQIQNLRAIELDADCCGIAGTYGLKKEKYEISMTVGERLFGQLRESKGDLAACDSETCRWQITHATGVATRHPIEVLRDAYGLVATADRRRRRGRPR